MEYACDEGRYFAMFHAHKKYRAALDQLIPQYEREGLALVFGFDTPFLGQFYGYVYFDGKKYKQNSKSEDAKRQQEQKRREQEIEESWENS